eukprot:scaffold49242_cov85-Cyclotella_meneghiniana.AAC.1
MAQHEAQQGILLSLSLSCGWAIHMFYSRRRAILFTLTPSSIINRSTTMAGSELQHMATQTIPKPTNTVTSV